MTTYLVATVTRYVLVEAENEAQARELAMPALYELYADFRERCGEFPIEIHTVRQATQAEIDLWTWHQRFPQGG